MKKIITNTIMSLLIVLSSLFIVSCTDSNDNNNNNNNENNNENYEDIDMESNIINVYLIGGQSNAVGYGQDTGNVLANTDSRFINGFDNVLYFSNQERYSGADTNVEFKPVKIGFGNNSDTCGAEIGIANAVKDNGEMNAIIKCAWGATHLYPDINYNVSLEQGTWTSPSYIEKHNLDLETYPHIGGMYRWFEETVAQGIKLLIEEGYTPVIKGMWWMQGEAEMGSKQMSDAYEELLRTLIFDIRNTVGEITGYDCSDMPFVFGLPSWNSPYPNAPVYQEEVRNTMSKVANDTSFVNAAYVDTRGQNQHDMWHFDAAGQKYLGENFVKELAKLNEGKNSKFLEKVRQNDIKLNVEEKGLELSANLTSHMIDNNYEYGFVVVPTSELTENNITNNFIEHLEDNGIEYNDIPCYATGEEMDEYYDVFIKSTFAVDYKNLNTSYTAVAYILDENGNYLYATPREACVSVLASKELYTSTNNTDKIQEIINAGVNSLFNVPEGNSSKPSDLEIEVVEQLELTNSQSAKPTKLAVEQHPTMNYYVEYSSSNESVVSVSEDGYLTTHKAGNAVITVKCGGKTKSVNVVVNNQTVDGVCYDGVVSSNEYVGKTITKSNNKITASITGMVVNQNIHLSVVITHGTWSTSSRVWYWNDNIEFYIDGIQHIVKFMDGVAVFPSGVAQGVVNTVSKNGKLETTVEMMIEGNKNEYKLKLGMNGKRFDWLGALWEPVDQPDITEAGLTYPQPAGLPNSLTMDGVFNESVWNGVNKNNNITVTANGANVNIVGTIYENGVLYGVTVNHKKAPEVSTNGDTNWYNYMNIEFQFNNGSSQFIYTCKNEQYIDAFFGYCKTITNSDGSYTSTFEIYIPFTSIGVSNGTTSLDFTTSGWFESGWCWFFPENQNWTATHKISSNGIVRK